MADTPESITVGIDSAHSLAGNGTQALIDTAQQAVRPQELKPEAAKAFAFAVPPGATLQVHSLEEYAPTPYRTRGTYVVYTVESFIEYVKRFEHEATSVWVHPTSGEIVAVINDHHPSEGADWLDHRCQLTLVQTEEWKHWTGRDGILGSQEEFAEHIEDGVKELVSPDAATMLEIAQTFHMTQSATFRSARRLSDGQVQVAYDEENQASAGRSGDITVPTEIELAIAPFIGEAPYKVVARLRYRVNRGGFTIGYKLDRPDAVVRDALDGIRNRLAGEFDNVYAGTAPGAAA